MTALRVFELVAAFFCILITQGSPLEIFLTIAGYYYLLLLLPN